MYIKLENGEPKKYTIEQLRLDNPRISFPRKISNEILAEYSVYPYARPQRPVYDLMTSKAVDGTFEQDAGGNWLLPWVVERLPLDQAELNIRDNRRYLLAETDWIVVMHAEKGTKIPLEWEVYRQALRDITDQEGFPYEVEWPVKP